MKLNRLFFLKAILYGTLVYFIYLLALISIQYIPINYEIAFLNLKQEEIKLTYYKFAFFSHVYSSIIIITLGLTQFSTTIRNQFPFIHKINFQNLYRNQLGALIGPIWVATKNSRYFSWNGGSIY